MHVTLAASWDTTDNFRHTHHTSLGTPFSCSALLRITDQGRVLAYQESHCEYRMDLSIFTFWIFVDCRHVKVPSMEPLTLLILVLLYCSISCYRVLQQVIQAQILFFYFRSCDRCGGRNKGSPNTHIRLFVQRRDRSINGANSSSIDFVTVA